MIVILGEKYFLLSRSAIVDMVTIILEENVVSLWHIFLV